jgi:hypothetical protein
VKEKGVDIGGCENDFDGWNAKKKLTDAKLSKSPFFKEKTHFKIHFSL